MKAEPLDAVGDNDGKVKRKMAGLAGLEPATLSFEG